MADAGTLADADHLYFLRHDEIADCLGDESGQIAALACDRQNVFGRQSSFQFRDVFTGKPEPLSVEADTFIDFMGDFENAFAKQIDPSLHPKLT